jgi:asparagine synthase (glutamine-hydrolysing)
MCGIAGVVMRDGSNPAVEVLDKLERALWHRGPDGSGRYVANGVGFIHRRLSIIDLKTGAQPLFGPTGTVLVANAEIYNYVELRRDLLSGARFSTASDCETILHLYDREGPNCDRHLRGMYAFALYDPVTRNIVLSRDPFGMKPLYYAETPTCIAFASEPQALVAAGLVVAELEPQASRELLQLQFATGAQTAFKDIKRVLPGETLVFNGGRLVSRTVLASLPDAARSIALNEDDALEELDRRLMDSVAIHQRSDVPYGLFLSGGIDSRAILACMARLGTAGVRAYTASFPNSSVPDEYPSAQKAAALFGAQTTRVEVTVESFWSALPHAIAAVDDPTADAAIVPTFILAREAAKDVKVVLCGEGGDEIFAGYSRYRRQSRPWWLGGRQRRRRGLFSEAGILREEPVGWRDGLAASEHASRVGGRSRLQIAQATDCADFLAHGLLIKLDRSLMANGVEGRTPFLDRQIADFGFALPKSLQIRKRRGKFLLRRWLDQQAPQDDCFARKKGFTPPYIQWLRAAGNRLGPLVAADPAIEALCRPQAVQRLFVSDNDRDLEAAWTLLFFALWHRQHIRGLAPDGDTLACLAQRA